MNSPSPNQQRYGKFQATLLLQPGDRTSTHAEEFWDVACLELNFV